LRPPRPVRAASETRAAACRHRRPAGSAARSHREEAEMPTWFWLNIPVGAVLFAAMVGIPLWLVSKHPDTGREIEEAAARRRAAVPLRADSMAEAVRWRDAA
jgi:hypothetical protein